MTTDQTLTNGSRTLYEVAVWETSWLLPLPTTICLKAGCYRVFPPSGPHKALFCRNGVICSCHPRLSMKVRAWELELWPTDLSMLLCPLPLGFPPPVSSPCKSYSLNVKALDCVTLAGESLKDHGGY